jgi:hypothetical protein
LYQGISQIYPGLTERTRKSSRLIGNQLAGELSPETINQLQDKAALFGLQSGLPLTQFTGNKGLTMLGQDIRAEQQRGLDNQLKQLDELSKLVTDPNLAASLAMWNAVNSAAPDPTQAAREQERLYQRYLSRTLGAARSPAGGFTPPRIDTPTADSGGYGGGGIFVARGPDTGTTTQDPYGDWFSNASTWGYGPRSGTGTGFSYSGPDYSWMNPEDYAYALEPGVGTTSPAYDFESMYSDMGLPYTDWSSVGGGTNADGSTWSWSDFE